MEQQGEPPAVPLPGALGNQTYSQWLNRAHVTPVISKCRLPKDSLEDVLDTILVACERFPWNQSSISDHIKRDLDKKFGAAWHVVIGESFSFEVTFESDDLVYLFYGSLAILAWKCGTVLNNEMKYKNVHQHQN